LEKDVDKQFVHFEKIAKSLTSPNEYWTLLLQSALTRKARETSSKYEEVKEAILKACELVSEVCRQKCRSCRKRDDKVM
jgi:dsDNA-specific endonuclease/ATPase MutS2